MVIKDLKSSPGQVIRLAICAVVMAGLLFPGILAQAVKASSKLSSGLERAPISLVGALQDAEYVLV